MGLRSLSVGFMNALELGSFQPSVGTPARPGEFQGGLWGYKHKAGGKGTPTGERRAEEEESGMTLRQVGLRFLLLCPMISARETQAYHFA